MRDYTEITDLESYPIRILPHSAEDCDIDMPQHPVYVYVHYGSIANPLKIVNISFCSLLFVDPLKLKEHIGINVASLRVKTRAFR
jgi:hypothetical protein